MEKNKVIRLIQVCAQVTDKNSNGEYNNLLEVMETLWLEERNLPVVFVITKILSKFTQTIE